MDKLSDADLDRLINGGASADNASSEQFERNILEPAPKWPSIVPSDAQNSHFAEPAWPVMHEAAYYG